MIECKPVELEWANQIKWNELLKCEVILIPRDFNEILADVHEMNESGSSEIVNYFGIDRILKGEKYPAPPDNKKPGFKLYEITELLEKCNALAEIAAAENEGVIPDDLAAELDKLEMNQKDKSLSICKLILDLRNRKEGIKAAKDRMDKRFKSISNDIERLENYLSLNITPGVTFEDPEVKLTWSNNTGVDIYDINQLPEKYIKYEFEIPYSEFASEAIEKIHDLKMKDPFIKIEKVALNKERIAPDIKKGIEIPGARKKTGQHIVIK